ncbi:response regulator transcription factor [Alkalihalobacillus trypoxylicola]|uniref:AraC family transcriptional regulator n=1 Tax=Alkalihalobacillus trypoxylicola TaxID=519424 RepID=A0A161PWV4_9BACI|nr:response regulator transcription factor [Alkalihalobacillus trypoxylicola]KYG26592.1 hypothetical protein AZF04_12335 [Alkalihalobacillus trypoxylicola]
MWKVVIVDDDEKVLRGMKKIIPWQELDCEWIGEARDGEEGFALIKQLNPDIVISDIYMPVKNGIEMIKQLRENHYDGKIVILSGYSEFEHARQAVRLRIDDYLTKPASIDTIRSVFSAIVEQLEEDQMNSVQVAELREKVKLYEPLIEKEWLKSLITGTVDHNHIPPAVKSMISKWDDQDHVILTIVYDQQLEQSKLYQSDWYLFRFAAGNIIRETTERYEESYQYVELHSHQAVICLHFDKDKQEEIKNKLYQLAGALEASLKIYLSVDVTVNVGGIKSDWFEIAQSLREASSKNNHHSLGDSDELLLQTTEGKRTIWSESMEANQKLSEAIRYADETSARQIIDEYFSKVDQQSYQSALAMQIGIELWTIMTYSLYDIGIRIDDMFDESLDIYQEINTIQSWDALSNLIKEKIVTICHHQQWDENLKHRQLVEQMIDFVQNRLNENITLQDLADELYISRNYLGQIFKKIVGESFKNYLTRIRMEKAKKMIQEGNYLIYEVSEKVGYVNPAYFTTTFKKYTGYTPTELIHRKLTNT